MSEQSGVLTSAGERYRVLGLVGLGHSLSHFYLLVLPPFFPLLSDSLGVGYAALGLSMTVFNVVSGLAQTPAGFLVDRLGPRALLIGGLTLEALAFCGIGIFSNYTALILLMAVAGFANSIFHPADYAIMASAIEPKRIGRAFSLHTFAGWGGGAIAPATMGVMILWFGWQGAVISAGVIGLGAAALMAANGKWLDIAVKPAAKAREPETKGNGLSVILSGPIMLCFVFYIFLAMSGGGITSFGVSVMVEAQGLSLNDAVTALSGFLFTTAAGILLGGLLADWTRHHEVVAIAGLLAGAAIVLSLAWLDPGPLLLLVALSIAGLFYGLIIPSRDMMVRSVTPPESVGKVFGFVSTGLNVARTITPARFRALATSRRGSASSRSRSARSPAVTVPNSRVSSSASAALAVPARNAA